MKWSLWCKYEGSSEYVLEESFLSLRDAQKARDEYKRESPRDMFLIRSILGLPFPK
jgi:hypothetical protein